MYFPKSLIALLNGQHTAHRGCLHCSIDQVGGGVAFNNLQAWHLVSQIYSVTEEFPYVQPIKFLYRRGSFLPCRCHAHSAISRLRRCMLYLTRPQENAPPFHLETWPKVVSSETDSLWSGGTWRVVYRTKSAGNCLILFFFRAKLILSWGFQKKVSVFCCNFLITIKFCFYQKFGRRITCFCLQ